MRALQPQVKAIQQRYWGSSLECRFFSEWNSATIVSIGPPKEEKKDGKKDMSSENAWVRMLLNSLSSQQSCKVFTFRTQQPLLQPNTLIWSITHEECCGSLH
ncbi:hypothetical protein CsatA_019124 [Cannabis sativa]